MQPPTRPLLLFCSAAIFLLAGCGYQQSGNYDKPAPRGYQWHSLYREDVQTVAVPTFQNRDFTRGIEFSLSKAVINQLEAHTPYKVVSRERADTILEGEVVSVRMNDLGHDRNTDLTQEMLLSVTVNFRWRDLHSGRVLVERKGFAQSTSYFPTLGEGQFVGNQQAVEKLALAIVEQLQAEW